MTTSCNAESLILCGLKVFPCGVILRHTGDIIQIGLCVFEGEQKSTRENFADSKSSEIIVLNINLSFAL